MQKISFNNYKNIIIPIVFILSLSIIYTLPIINIDFFKSTNNLSNFEIFINNEILSFIRILFSFLIPLTFYIFTFLFNSISLKSILITPLLILIVSSYLYNLPYELLIKMQISKDLISLLIHILFSNFIIVFIISLSYIKYDIKKINSLYDFYTIIAEVIIWYFLLYLILIFFSILLFVIMHNKIDIKAITIFLTKNNIINLKILYSIFILLNSSILYFSYLIYKKMLNTKLSITLSRTLIIFVAISSFTLIILNLKYNIISNNKIFLYIYLLFLIIFLKIIFLFRADRNIDKYEYYIYIISNIFAIIFSISILIYSNNFIITIFIIIVLINFIYNIAVFLLKKRSFIFYYNFIYIVILMIFLFA